MQAGQAIGTSQGNAPGWGGLECMKKRLTTLERVDVNGERGTAPPRRAGSVLPFPHAFRFALAAIPRAGTIANVSNPEKPDPTLPVRGQRRASPSLA